MFRIISNESRCCDKIASLRWLSRAVMRFSRPRIRDSKLAIRASSAVNRALFEIHDNTTKKLGIPMDSNS